MKNIVETATIAGNFSRFIEAVKAVGLVDILTNDDILLTVFVPNDSAFLKLMDGSFEKLMEDKERLRQILKYHMMDGKFFEDDILNLDVLETLEGSEINVDLEDGDVMIDDAMIVRPDVLCTNGIIHVIDRVLIPEEY